MNKSLNVPVVSFEDLTIENLLIIFGSGEEIIFITNGGRLFGAITQGDFNRGLKNGREKTPIQLVNTRIQKIVLRDKYNDERQYECEAEEIFSHYKNINNIPVIDGNGTLCFQYEREKNFLQNRVINVLQSIDRRTVFEAFYQCNADSRIVIMGADNETMEKVKNFFEYKYNSVVQGKRKLKISTQSILQNSMLESGDVVIALTPFCETYLQNHVNCRSEVILLDGLLYYGDYAKVYDLPFEALLIWKEIFQYEEVIILEDNQYTNYAKSLLERCGLDVEVQSKHDMTILGVTSETVQFIFKSDNGKHLEGFSFGRLVQIVQLIEDYCQVSKMEYSKEEYVASFKRFITMIEKFGIKYLHYAEYNKLDSELISELSNSSISILENGEDSCNEKCVADYRCRRSSKNAFIFDFVCECIQYSIDNVIYKKLKNYCGKVFRFNPRSLDEVNYVEYPEQSRTNYIRGGRYSFPENFVEDMYGDKSYSVEELLKDMSGCHIENIGNGYMKYQSNYVSKNFNTDLYGNRITTDIPADYMGTIYLLGRCTLSGYAVSDCDTPSSYLQREVNKCNLPYRVVNLSIDNGVNQYIYQKVLEREMKCSDIVIMQFHWADSGEEQTFALDYGNMDRILGGRRYYWDSVSHCNSKGYELVAKCIFEHVKNILMPREKYQFKLNDKLEKEIEKYINKIKEQFLNSYQYKQLYVKKRSENRSGAIVMNCNPFTYGHYYLVETASRLVDVLYVFVVEEDKSFFSFQDRFKMVKNGVKDLSNVVVCPGGEFMISTVTFPGYFMKEAPTAECYDSFLDLKIFGQYIAPAFNITMRIVGEEPFDKVTARYNHDMGVILAETGITVIEVPRKKLGNDTISATVVRRMLTDGNWSEIRRFVPDSTYNVLVEKMGMKGY